MLGFQWKRTDVSSSFGKGKGYLQRLALISLLLMYCVQQAQPLSSAVNLQRAHVGELAHAPWIWRGGGGAQVKHVL